ncbi:TetR/AcrR family transcriptional regulator [Nocardia africana]|uniref:Solvent efflux pump srpABC operon corepressor n=1 Tax=Nocardia africana TaxID=134964 RepID=A0A378WLI5_9NOCA|nr:TetR/AcrR family transcriptional regulator [Nocardia africana]MCC3316374.1 TetR/AcrR family transcriptional regulator; helix-turn-helix transcriptional regulator [Nocardia africana]SUA41274.1 Solvent efflux pump srpABC operon corepressor [Nocardia africana]
MAEKQLAEPAAEPRRALRADARRNRERVLAAAREAFAAEGISVPLDEIARRAGVGPGTVYRHFPTKEALFHAAIVDNIERMIDYARRLESAGDPGAAFFDLLDHMVAEGGVKRDLADALGGHETIEITGPTKEFQAVIARLLRRAQDSGAIRGDIDFDDLMRVLKGTFAGTHTATGEQRTRAFAVVFDGLRARCEPAG